MSIGIYTNWHLCLSVYVNATIQMRLYKCDYTNATGASPRASRRFTPSRRAKTFGAKFTNYYSTRLSREVLQTAIHLYLRLGFLGLGRLRGVR